MYSSILLGPPLKKKTKKTSSVRIESLSVNLLSDFAETFQRFTASDGGRLLSLPRHFSSDMHIQARPLDSSALPAPVHTWIPSLVFPRFYQSDPARQHNDGQRLKILVIISGVRPCENFGGNHPFVEREKNRSDGSDTSWLLSQREQTAPSYLAKWGVQVFSLRFSSMFLLASEISWKHI